MVDLLALVFQALWFIFPAYASNAIPILIKGRRPLDSGKKLGKYRVLGDGKTYEGTIGGVAFGVFAGWLQMSVHPFLPQMGLFEFTFPVILLLSAGAILGDIAGAFVKRRLGIPRGYPAPVLDQLDFLAGALLFASLLMNVGTPTIIILVMLTPIVHVATNRISFWLKMKKVPW